MYSILVILLAVVLVIRHFTHKSIPDYDADAQLPGMSSDVEVYRDSLGIPHIYAKTEKDLYTAVGYVMAQDRLWQMDLLRRVTTGRLAEILSDDLLEVDVLMRSLEMTRKSEKIYAEASPALKNCVDAFASGVNHFMETHRNKLPFEFRLLGYDPEAWKPEHSINLIGYMAWDLSTGWPNELTLHKIKNQVDEARFRDLIPNVPGHSSSVFSDFGLDADTEALLSSLQRVSSRLDELGLDVFRGSNNWAVNGTRSESGKPLLANDMHLGLSIPGVWYQMHQVVEGKLDVTGVVLPGQPMVIAGHNQQIAWGFTNVMTDGLDFYEETIHPDHPDQYLVDGAWQTMRTKTEYVINKAGDTLVFENKYTHRGPVVTEIKAIPGKTISMSWIGLLESNELQTVYLLNRAGNWEEFREAIKTFISVNQNIIYADTDGNIGLHATIGLPLREKNGMEIYPGDTSLYDWKGLVPFEELPFSFNPESGYLSSANNRTVDADYPYYVSSWFDLPYRQDRIQELLSQKRKITIQDYIDLQADQKSKMAEKFTPVFLQALEGAELAASGQKALERLRAWDYELDTESIGATLFEYLYYQVARELALDEMGEELFEEFINKKGMVKNFMENILAHPESPWCDKVHTSEKTENYSELVRIAFQEALKQIGVAMGVDQDEWQWGHIHTLKLEHPLSSVQIIDRLLRLSRGPFPVGGSHHTVCPYAYDYMDPSTVDHGASHRHIYDLSDWDQSLTVIPTGTSGVPASRHYCDQTDLYINNAYHRDHYDRERVMQSARYHMVIRALAD